MTLDKYLERPRAIRLTKLAAMIGVSHGRLSQLRHSTDWPPALALKIERATGEVLDAADISPVIAEARKGVS